MLSLLTEPALETSAQHDHANHDEVAEPQLVLMCAVAQSTTQQQMQVVMGPCQLVWTTAKSMH